MITIEDKRIQKSVKFKDLKLGETFAWFLSDTNSISIKTGETSAYTIGVNYGVRTDIDSWEEAFPIDVHIEVRARE